MSAIVSISDFTASSSVFSLDTVRLYDDVWRVLYLKGYFQDVVSQNHDSLIDSHLNTGLAEVGSKVSFCVFIEGVRFTNCRGGDSHELFFSTEKTLVIDGKLKKVVFSVGK